MASEIVTAERKARIQEGLIAWFRANSRDLPWRQTRDPYAILVSEVMLQQTQVDRVLPYYHRFLSAFPDVRALAAAETAEVIRLWSGLGYNRRAVNLQRAARAVVDHFGGVFPDTPEQLRHLPGVGAYTAGAVAAFAFERDAVFLDTNMRRVIDRLCFSSDDVSEKAILAAAAQLLPPGQGWEWNQALIEFGALQCTARRPACVVCPLNAACAAFPTMQSRLANRKAHERKKGISPTPKFETTSRYYRGRIVETLRSLPAGANGGLELDVLGARIREGYSASDAPWLRELVAGLQRDGLAVISEESPTYDESEEPGAAVARVRLP